MLSLLLFSGPKAERKKERERGGKEGMEGK